MYMHIYIFIPTHTPCKAKDRAWKGNSPADDDIHKSRFGITSWSCQSKAKRWECDAQLIIVEIHFYSLLLAASKRWTLLDHSFSLEIRRVLAIEISRELHYSFHSYREIDQG